MVITEGKYLGRAHASAVVPSAQRSLENRAPIPGAPQDGPKIDQKSIKQMIIFRCRVWIDLGSFWDSNLATFSAKFRPQTVLGPF